MSTDSLSLLFLRFRTSIIVHLHNSSSTNQVAKRVNWYGSFKLCTCLHARWLPMGSRLQRSCRASDWFNAELFKVWSLVNHILLNSSRLFFLHTSVTMSFTSHLFVYIEDATWVYKNCDCLNEVMSDSISLNFDWLLMMSVVFLYDVSSQYW